MKTIKWDGAMPPCQVHHMRGGPPCTDPGACDVMSTAGHWGDFCETHVPQVTSQLGRDIGFRRVQVGVS